MELTYQIVWILLFVILLIAEGLTAQLVSIWGAIGALCACIVSLFGAPLWLQVLVFLVVTALTVIATRPLVRKFVTAKAQSTNFDRILGQTGVVREKINNIDGEGCVFIDGKEWTARSSDGSIIEPDEKVVIDKIEGVKVFVSKKEDK